MHPRKTEHHTKRTHITRDLQFKKFLKLGLISINPYITDCIFVKDTRWKKLTSLTAFCLVTKSTPTINEGAIYFCNKSSLYKLESFKLIQT